jgi:hypothetical protein
VISRLQNSLFAKCNLQRRYIVALLQASERGGGGGGLTLNQLLDACEGKGGGKLRELELHLHESFVFTDQDEWWCKHFNMKSADKEEKLRKYISFRRYHLEAGLYSSLKAPGFQPLNLKFGFLVLTFAFNLCAATPRQWP